MSRPFPAHGIKKVTSLHTQPVKTGDGQGQQPQKYSQKSVAAPNPMNPAAVHSAKRAALNGCFITVEGSAAKTQEFARPHGRRPPRLGKPSPPWPHVCSCRSKDP